MEKEVYLQKHDTEWVLEKGLMLDSGSPLKSHNDRASLSFSLLVDKMRVIRTSKGLAGIS